MPVQPIISLEQIVTMVAFLLLLFALMWFVRRHRGGIAGRIHADRRMLHIEDISLAQHQRLHLIEVDGRTFLVHAGKGHAASFIAVDGDLPAAPQVSQPAARPAAKSKTAAKPQSTVQASAKSQAAAAPAKPKSALAAAIAAARRNNPSVEFGK